MRFVVAAAALLAASPAFAAEPVAADKAAAAPAPVTARRGTMLRDANDVRLGAVNTVRADGSVGIIYQSRYVLVPADTLSMVDGKLTTKLTRAELTASR